VFARLFLLLTLLPLVEILLLAWIGSHTSWAVVVGLVLGTGLAGAWIVRRHSWRTVERIRADLAAGRVPAASLFDGMLVFVAGALLILPGVLSDAAAMLLLLPITRRALRSYLKWRFATRAYSAYGNGAPHRRDEIIDVRVIESRQPAER
jgi:UPF0716 protein FxsA